MEQIGIGCGAGYSGDRIEPARELAERGAIRYLVFECLAERTIALAQLARMRDPAKGYDPLLEARMEAVLPACHARGIKVITNMGAANPLGAARMVRARARALGLGALKVAAVTGDDVLERVRANGAAKLDETGASVASLGNRLVSANAYLGASPIVEALAHGADVVVTGRVADPALFLAPMIHEFGWAMDDWHLLGQGTLVGHLLECAGQVTGGYFADPGVKDVPDLARLGFPLAEVAEDGAAVLTKLSGTGGTVSLATCKEQLLYEVHDPSRYLQPDVVADFSGACFTALGPDRVRVEGATGHARTRQLKVSVGYHDGWIGEGQITYAGPNAVARARLARDVVEERLRLTGALHEELRLDLVGLDSAFGGAARPSEPGEVRLRVAARTASEASAMLIGNEVESLYLNGPYGGGGATKSVREVIAVGSLLIDEQQAIPGVEMVA
jgi:hypothetical protein